MQCAQAASAMSSAAVYTFSEQRQRLTALPVCLTAHELLHFLFQLFFSEISITFYSSYPAQVHTLGLSGGTASPAERHDRTFAVWCVA